MLSLKSVVKHSKDIFWQDVIDDVVMLSMENAQYFGAESTGAEIWRLLEAPISLEAICENLLSQFDVDRASCEAEVLDFVEQLKAAGLIEVIAD